MNMPDHLLLYIVFLSQMFLLSYFLPKKIVARINYVLKNYPKETYPKLYPRSVEYFEGKRDFYKNFNRFNLLLGFGVMFLIFPQFEAGEEKGLQMVPWAYFMVQMIPSMLTEVFSFKQAKMMRTANPSKSRQASFMPRRLFDFVSPLLVLTAVLMFIVFSLTVSYMFDFDLTFGGKALPNILVLLGGNLFFIIIIAWNLRGKKLDPHQAHKDRVRIIEVVIKSLTYLSIAMSLFMLLLVLSSYYEWHFVKPVMMSLFLQTIALISMGTPLQTLPIGSIDFDVYKADTKENAQVLE